MVRKNEINFTCVFCSLMALGSYRYNFSGFVWAMIVIYPFGTVISLSLSLSLFEEVLESVRVSERERLFQRAKEIESFLSAALN